MSHDQRLHCFIRTPANENGKEWFFAYRQWSRMWQHFLTKKSLIPGLIDNSFSKNTWQVSHSIVSRHPWKWSKFKCFLKTYSSSLWYENTNTHGTNSSTGFFSKSENVDHRCADQTQIVYKTDGSWKTSGRETVLADGVYNSVTKNFLVPFARLALRASSAHCVLFSALRAFWSAF